MKKLFFLTVILAFVAGLYSCKTTEANYKNAYEIAKKKNTETGDSLIDKSLAGFAVPKNVTVMGVTLPMVTEPVALSKGNFPDGYVMKRYCVVVARFTQLFNAQQMRQRMLQQGYNEAALLQNRSNQYYVSVATTSVVADAEVLLNKVKADSSIVLREPYPYILRPAQLAR